MRDTVPIIRCPPNRVNFIGGVPSYLYADYLRSVVGASNGATVEYTPFGLVRTSSGTLPTDHQFQGQ